ncbi:hypothetical protein B0H10DRAFT_1110620 [Mycena sp. CBHHK59/15]|nr:hypothetical protein B0H10DRAFT_1110620 [Mycena sp. CBHHK59/15]
MTPTAQTIGGWPSTLRYGKTFSQKLSVAGGYQATRSTTVPGKLPSEIHILTVSISSNSPTTHVSDVLTLKTMFITEFAAAALSRRPHDILVIVLCGHGDRNGDILVGAQAAGLTHLRKADVEVILTTLTPENQQDRNFVVSTACYAGQWRSNLRTLFGAAEVEEESVAIRESGSGECRGGIFTLAEQTDEYGLATPHTVAHGFPDEHIFSVDTFSYQDRSDPILGTLLDPTSSRTPASPRR